MDFSVGNVSILKYSTICVGNVSRGVTVLCLSTLVKFNEFSVVGVFCL
jgi:hypothetical protein